MKRLSAIVLVLMLAALPLRGVAAVIADLCGPQHSAAAMQASHECCDGAEAPDHGKSHHDGQGQAEGSCSHCAACSVGASAVSDAAIPVTFALPHGAPIPFADRRVPAGVTERLDRPPLSL